MWPMYGTYIATLLGLALIDNILHSNSKFSPFIAPDEIYLVPKTEVSSQKNCTLSCVWMRVKLMSPTNYASLSFFLAGIDQNQNCISHIIQYDSKLS
jgi:hypothetical protein